MTVYSGHLPDADDLESDEQQHAAQSGVRDVRQRSCAEGEDGDDNGGGEEPCELGSSAGLRYDSRARRTRVDRKGAEKTGYEVLPHIV